ncbi:unnamed protein product, partial [Rotaria sp. Silwood2]
VADLKEYNAALELSRIWINNRWLTIALFLSGNRLTYCSKYWKIEHLHENCKMSYQQCRICLEEVSKKEVLICINVSKCAQCEGEHHYLHGQCHVIQQYRADLKEDVTKALKSGKLRRHESITRQPTFSMKQRCRIGKVTIGAHRLGHPWMNPYPNQWAEQAS